MAGHCLGTHLISNIAAVALALTPTPRFCLIIVCFFAACIFASGFSCVCLVSALSLSRMTNGGALSGTAGAQIFLGFILIVIDISSMGMYKGFSVTTYTGFVFGIFYIVTGSLGVAAGSAVSRAKSSTRCLTITSMVMSVLSILNSFGLAIYVGTWVAFYAVLDRFSVFGVRYGAAAAAALCGVALAMYIIMFLMSIVVCVMASRAMSSSRSTVTHVTHVVQQPGVVYNAQQQTQTYAYPAGQPVPKV
ncbi:uncharacterized protein LOC129602609 [Paramacrobiotus metropolitanus]|uniref:uncharacterized protein LOC129602609 n=1 Tax=Paramacrobiotus metropolitanus TaxID=2943436 RepID=UPI00244603D5|nr:uncharacterized protein LOC129602609 [Paramacrobiotus metropolitanus]